MQLCSRAATGNRPYEARVLKGPFTIRLVDGFEFTINVVRTPDDTQFIRSAIDARSGQRIGRVASCRTKARMQEHVQSLVDRLISTYGSAEVRRRIESAPELREIQA